jgi:hypothetical protein
LRGELFARMSQIRTRGLIMSIAWARRLARSSRSEPTSGRGNWEHLALFEIGGTRCVISLVGALRPDNRLIFTFTLTTRRCRASGRKRCGFNVHTAELNTKQWWSGLRRGCSRMNPQRAAQGISAPRGSRGEGKLTERIMPSLSCRADTRPSDTKIRPVRGALRAIVGRCMHISQNVARN